MRPSLITRTFALVVCVASLAGAPTHKEQEVLDRAAWHWSDAEANIFYSMSQSGAAYQIELIRPPGGWDKLTIRFVKDGNEICSWSGHSRSVFVQQENVLVYALYHPSSEGCTLVAINLETGRELWKSKLKAAGPSGGHSAYGNLINLNASEGKVTVIGKEDLGNYMETVDIQTGQTLAHRIFKASKA